MTPPTETDAEAKPGECETMGCHREPTVCLWRVIDDGDGGTGRETWRCGPCRTALRAGRDCNLLEVL